MGSRSFLTIPAKGACRVSMSSAALSTTEASSVYVHAPFCARRCVYCDFAVTVQKEGDVDGWTQGLKSELAYIEAENLLVSVSYTHLTLPTIYSV